MVGGRKPVEEQTAGGHSPSAGNSLNTDEKNIDYKIQTKIPILSLEIRTEKDWKTHSVATPPPRPTCVPEVLRSQLGINNVPPTAVSIFCSRGREEVLRWRVAYTLPSWASSPGH
jgi:hypothetical protein